MSSRDLPKAGSNAFNFKELFMHRKYDKIRDYGKQTVSTINEWITEQKAHNLDEGDFPLNTMFDVHGIDAVNAQKMVYAYVISELEAAHRTVTLIITPKSSILRIRWKTPEEDEIHMLVNTYLASKTIQPSNDLVSRRKKAASAASPLV